MKNAVLIYNPVAGRHPARRERQIQQVATTLRGAGIGAKLLRTSGPGTAVDLARTAVEEGTDVVLVCGGDGTINEVVNGVAHSNAALGILTGGTANIIARELRLPHDPVGAARQVACWRPRRIALGHATWVPAEKPGVEQQRFFLSVAGIGFDAHIVHRLSNDLKMSLGVVAYAWEAVRQALCYSFPSFLCRLDGQEYRATFAVVHRTKLYAGWFHLAPSANLFEPRFILCLFKSQSRARYFLYAAAAIARQHSRLLDVELVDAREIAVAGEGDTTIRFELDGELVGALPATFEIVPDALTLLVP